ncbi:hypothetical protein BGZ61DRAFT_542626 [Ilyonectria robusta]|uniref:uncharacterized protein n=1 Tax=Ilyonectria robusta TaxID=1079257 RepID=UPI001E8E01AC|nr:uncharacterized protein BGZ61DRAFT_542626 [Ilyonectria robusta]KAH8646419.1 hypothetical protein BGZ61DRAFT_542626 [Ilyonectria robusta]
MATLRNRNLKPGAYVATLTFFTQSSTLDLETLKYHTLRLIDSGVSGIVALGSNGEAVHLDRQERKTVVKCIVDTLAAHGHGDTPVIVGASAQSVHETIGLCQEAKESGGSHVLVLPPSYFTAAMTPDTIYDFYMKVAAASPLPVILYSFPEVSSGITMSSDLLIRISKGHPNIVGTKFTCGDTGKLARVARAMDGMTPSKPEKPYWVAAGLADFTLQALAVGASGVVAGGANILPKMVVKVYELYAEGRFQEATQLQSLLSEGDWPHTSAGISGTKAVLQEAFQYGGLPRSPLAAVSAVAAQTLRKDMREALEYENSIR